ncbi:MAG TPA: dihydroorotase [Candidatus Cybelea sp.]|jgi:dihydroorotase|nr:dihydroorotase [Candidatus Cybelea sp.]
MAGLLIRGGRIVDPVAGIDARGDLRVSDGLVIELGAQLEPRDDERIIDASNAIVAPGFIDMHVHLREPGYPEKETIATGTEAAVRGGFTAVACMPNTNPALDAAETLGDLQERVARDARCRVYPIAAMTLERKGLQPCDYPALARAGAVGFSDDGDTVRDARVMFEAAMLALETDGVFISHCEDPSFASASGAPAIAEDLAAARDLLIAIATRKRWHIAHCSTARVIELIAWARERGARVTCEATPHHLILTSDVAADLGPASRVNPPLRTQADCAALRRAVFDGTLDALATDHAPHTAREKSGEDAPAAPGFSGLEIAVGAYALALEGLPLARFIELLSCNPAQILGVAGGTLRAGAPADVTIFAEREWIVDPSRFASKGKTTPFSGRRLPRRVVATVVAGEIRYLAPELAA